MLPTQSQISKGERQQALYNLFTAYLHTVPLEELIDSVERAKRDSQLRHVAIYGATCSYCLSRAKRLDGSYLRTFALELKEQLALTFAAIVTSILTQPNRRLEAKEAVQPPRRQIIEVLQQAMCTHDAEKLAISVLEIYDDGYPAACSKGFLKRNYVFYHRAAEWALEIEGNRKKK